jgi:hypothetical protein
MTYVADATLAAFLLAPVLLATLLHHLAADRRRMRLRVRTARRKLHC